MNCYCIWTHSALCTRSPSLLRKQTAQISGDGLSCGHGTMLRLHTAWANRTSSQIVNNDLLVGTYLESFEQSAQSSNFLSW